MEERSSPLFSQLALWIAFALILVVSVFTVLIPELSSNGAPEEQPAPSTPAPH